LNFASLPVTKRFVLFENRRIRLPCRQLSFLHTKKYALRGAGLSSNKIILCDRTSNIWYVTRDMPKHNTQRMRMSEHWFDFFVCIRVHADKVVGFAVIL
jgi:hypothetical protein